MRYCICLRVIDVHDERLGGVPRCPEASSGFDGASAMPTSLAFTTARAAPGTGGS